MLSAVFSDLESLPQSGYIEPKTVREACSLLSQYTEKAKVIAGGTKLLALMKKGKISPEFVINLKNIPELEYISYSDAEGLTIGALATLTHLQDSSIVREKFAIVAQAIQEMKPERIPRWAYYMATIGGTLATAAPSADVTLPLIALGAKAKIAGPKGWRTGPLEQFFTGPGTTILQSDEILTEVQLQAPPADAGMVYMKFPSTKDTPAIGAAVLIVLDARHVNVTDAAIVLGAVAPTPIRAHNAEAVIKGKAIDEDLIKKAAQAAAEEGGTIADVSSALVKQLVEQSITQATEHAIGDFAMGY